MLCKMRKGREREGLETSPWIVWNFCQFTRSIFRCAVEAGKKYCGKKLWCLLVLCHVIQDLMMIYLNVLSGKHDYFPEMFYVTSLLVMNYCKHSAMSWYVLTLFEWRCWFCQHCTPPALCFLLCRTVQWTLMWLPGVIVRLLWIYSCCVVVQKLYSPFNFTPYWTLYGLYCHRPLLYRI